MDRDDSPVLSRDDSDTRRGEGVPPAVAISGRDVQGRRAGVATRLIANVLDFFVMTAILGSVYFVVAALRFMWNPRTFRFPAPPIGTVIAVGSVVAVAYFAVCWRTTGRTYGDYVLGLRVLGRQESQLRVGQAVLRAIACVVLPIGLLWTPFSRKSSSLQDILARTRVVYDWSRSAP